MLKWICKFKCFLGPKLWQLRGDGSRNRQGKSSTSGKIFNPMMGIWHLWKERGWRGSRIGKEVIWPQHTFDSHRQSNRKLQNKDFPLQYSCLENPMDRGAWQATVHGVAKSQIWLSTRAHTHIHTHTHTHTHQALGLRPCSVMARGQLPRKALPLFKGQKRILKVLTTGSSQLTTLLAAEWQILSWKKIQAARHHRCDDINKYKHQYENYVINYLWWTAAY